MYMVVTVNKSDIFAFGTFDTVIAGIGQTTVFLMKIAETGILSAKFFGNGSAAVGGIIVDQQYLIIHESLISDRSQTAS